MAKSCDQHTHCGAECNSCTSNHNPLLTGLDLERRAHLDDSRSNVIFNKGEIIFKEGQFPTGLYCLSKGKVMITREDEHGNTIITNLHKEVTFLGISDFILQQTYQTRCIALSDVEVCLLSGKSIQEFISENKAFAHRVMVELATQFQEANARMLALTKKHMDARLAESLIELALLFGESTDGFIDVYLKRAELATLSNMSEANVIRNLSTFQKMGMIETDGKKIKIIRKDKLSRMSKFN